MIYTKNEMYQMLIDYVGLTSENLDIMLKLIGDTPQSYIKILHASSNYNTFMELEDSFFNCQYY